ncbi:MAG: MarR family EPS-associated transcriptional regulator [Campylobacterales bacterium]
MHQDELTLQILRRSESIKSQPSLAKELGYSVGKINYILNALIDKGLIKAENFATAKQKKKYKYLLTKKGIEEKLKLTERFVQRKKREYDELQAELEAHRQSELV